MEAIRYTSTILPHGQLVTVEADAERVEWQGGTRAGADHIRFARGSEPVRFRVWFGGKPSVWIDVAATASPDMVRASAASRGFVTGV